MPTRALILVDLQNDFLPEGALPVPRGYEIIAVANRIQSEFELILATQDWHPPNHVSFAANYPGRQPGDTVRVDDQLQVLWPIHCVQNTRGAALATNLDQRRIARVFHKGVDPRIDSYSAFFDNAGHRATGLEDFLLDSGVREVVLAGLATDYCVAYSALDALKCGLQATVVRDACRGIDLHPGDVATALARMEAAGVRLVDSYQLLSQGIDR